MVERVLPVKGHIDGYALIAQPDRHRLAAAMSSEVFTPYAAGTACTPFPAKAA